MEIPNLKAIDIRLVSVNFVQEIGLSLNFVIIMMNLNFVGNTLLTHNAYRLDLLAVRATQMNLPRILLHFFH